MRRDVDAANVTVGGRQVALEEIARCVALVGERGDYDSWGGGRVWVKRLEAFRKSIVFIEAVIQHSDRGVVQIIIRGDVA